MKREQFNRTTSYISGILSIQSFTKSGSFAKNVFTLLSASSIAVLISTAAAPIITRLYGPQDYGFFALYTSITSIISVIATGRYELAVMLPKDDEDSINILALCIAVSFVMSVITFLLIWVFNQYISSVVGNKEIASWLFFIPISVFCTGIYQSNYYWANRKKHYQELAVSRISLASSVALVNIGLGCVKAWAGGLILGGIAGQGISTVVLGSQNWKKDKKYKTSISAHKVFHYFKVYKEYLIYNSPTALLSSISQSLPIFLLSRCFDSFILGSYSLSLRVLYLPLTLISSSIEQVFYQKVTEKYHNGEPTRPLIIKMAFIMSAIYFLPALIIALFGTQLFSLLFGSQWKTAGQFSQWLIFPFCFRSVVAPLSMSLLTANKVKLVSLWNLLYFVTITTTLLIAAQFSIKAFLLIFGLHEIILYSIYFWLTLRVTRS